MKRDRDPLWRRFERVAADFESRLGSRGVQVKCPDRIVDAVTKRRREVDATIRERMADGTIRLTAIECRRRRGRADDPWIEQLASKKIKIGAHRLIAISSTGFSNSAKLSAAYFGIELRTINEFSEDGLLNTFGGLRVSIGVTDYSLHSVELTDAYGMIVAFDELPENLSAQLAIDALHLPLFLTRDGSIATTLNQIIQSIGADGIAFDGKPVLRSQTARFRDNEVFVQTNSGLRALSSARVAVVFECYEQSLRNSYAAETDSNVPNARHLVVGEGTLPDGTQVSSTFLGQVGIGARAI